MKNSSLYAALCSLLLLSSCGTTAYQASSFEDNIYYTPTRSARETIADQERQLAALSGKTTAGMQAWSAGVTDTLLLSGTNPEVSVPFEPNTAYYVSLSDTTRQFTVNLNFDDPYYDWRYNGWYSPYWGTWRSPWYYGPQFGFGWSSWYGWSAWAGWYDPWFGPYGPWYGWYDPWYGPWYGWYDPWYPGYPVCPSYPVDIQYGRRPSGTAGGQRGIASAEGLGSRAGSLSGRTSASSHRGETAAAVRPAGTPGISGGRTLPGRTVSSGTLLGRTEPGQTGPAVRIPATGTAAAATAVRQIRGAGNATAAVHPDNGHVRLPAAGTVRAAGLGNPAIAFPERTTGNTALYRRAVDRNTGSSTAYRPRTGTGSAVSVSDRPAYYRREESSASSRFERAVQQTAGRNAATTMRPTETRSNTASFNRSSGSSFGSSGMRTSGGGRSGSGSRR